MTRDLTIADIKAGLAGSVLRLAQELAPGGSVKGDSYSALNPTRHDRKRGSFHICVRGLKAGAFVDFATQDKGDSIDLIAYCRFGGVTRETRVQAIQWAKAWLGLDGAPPEKMAQLRREASERQKQADAEDARKAAWKRKRAFDLWNGAQPRLTGTIAQRYLEKVRGIEFSRLANMERSLRFAPRCQWWGADPMPVAPAFLGCFRDNSGLITGIHGTFLRPDGSGKADFDPPKLMFGTCKGSAIRIAKGKSGLTPEEAAAAGVSGPLIVTEGIENALTFAMAEPDLRIWAVGSVSNYTPLQKHPCVSAVLVAAENDEGEQAQNALDAALKHFASWGVPVEAIRSPVGNDINDLMMEDF